jgi:hypothetical protein
LVVERRRRSPEHPGQEREIKIMWAEWRFVLLVCGDGVPIEVDLARGYRWAAGGVGRSGQGRKADGGRRDDVGKNQGSRLLLSLGFDLSSAHRRLAETPHSV